MSGELLKRLEVKAIGESLPRGTTTNEDACPWCNYKSSFSVTHTWKGDIAYICHRASCGEAGYVRDRGVRGPATQERIFTPRVFNLATTGLGPAREASLLAAYGVTREEIDWAGWVYCPDGDRLAMPVLSPYRACRGWVTKRLSAGPGPKSDPFREVDDVWLGWYNQDPNQEGQYHAVVVVEDLISALVASRYHPTVAIMGTHLNEGMIIEILKQSYNVRLCLDGDATTKALGYVKKYGIHGNFGVVPLSNKDIKNMSEQERQEWNDQIKESLYARS